VWYDVGMNTNDVERLKSEIRYLRACLEEAYNALPTLPCNSQESWHVVSPIMRAMREYHTSFDAEFLPSNISKKQKRVSRHLTRNVTESEIVNHRPSAMSIDADTCTKFTPAASVVKILQNSCVSVDNFVINPKPLSIPNSALSTARSLGFDVDLS